MVPPISWEEKRLLITMRGDQCQNCDLIVVGVVVQLEGGILFRKRGNIHIEGVYTNIFPGVLY